MTKDWNAVQDEIKELSFVRKKSLEEVKAHMERKHNFRASTRAYRMKLKEWNLMRHRRRTTHSSIEHTGSDDDDSSKTVTPVADAASCEPAAYIPQRWQVLPEADLAHADPTFTGLLHQNIS